MNHAARILIVDDEASASQALSLVLSAGKFDDVAIATNAEEAFEALDLANPDDSVPPSFGVIMLDVMMPGMDGIEACARIRATRRYRDVPILMCTGVTEVESLNQAFIAGANDYLSKPFKKIELLARVRSAMRLKRELDRRRARESELRKAQHRDELPDERFFDRVTGMPSQDAFNAHARRAADRETQHGMLALQIAQAVRLREDGGEEAFSAVLRTVAAVIAKLRAGLLWRLFNFNDGLFMILAEEATDAEMSAVAQSAREAIAALQLVHGHSAEHDHVRLLTASARGHGTDLLTMPAELIRSFDRPAHGQANGNDTGMIAA